MGRLPLPREVQEAKGATRHDPQRYRGTPPKAHWITDRAARKAKAREIGRQRHAHLTAGGTFKSFEYIAPEVA